MASSPDQEYSDKPSTNEDAPLTHPEAVETFDKPTIDDVTLTSATMPSAESDTDKHGLNNVLLGSRVQKIKAINVRISEDRGIKDRGRCKIVGCCFMPGGELVLCDFDNYDIKLLDRSLTVVHSMYVPGAPRDVAVIDSSNVIVTMPRRRHLQFIQVTPALKSGRTIDTGLPCQSVAVAAGKIFVSCYNIGDPTGEIRTYGLDGKDLGKRFGVNRDGLRRAFRQPWYIAVSRTGDKIVLSDMFNETVICFLTSNGKTVFKYNDDGLKAPSGLFVDDGDNVIVGGGSSNTVQVITSAGKKHKTILTSKDGISDPTNVSFRPSDGTLVVCCRDSDKILVYKMS